MSKYIDEIVKDIRTNPDSWGRTGYTGLTKRDIILTCFGNGSPYVLFWATSVVRVVIAGKEQSTTWADNFKLEQTYRWWCRNVSLQTIRQ